MSDVEGGLFTNPETTEVKSETEVENEQETELFGETEPVEEAEPVAEETETGLFEDDESEESGESGIEKLQKRVKKKADQVREERIRRVTAEEQLGALRNADKAFNELYGQWPNPAAEMRWDNKRVSALFEAAESNDTLKQLMQSLEQHVTQGKSLDLSFLNQEKPMAESEKSTSTAADPRVERLLMKEVSSEVGNALNSFGVAKELHGVIKEAVLSTVELEDASPAKIKDAIKGFINEKMSTDGWTKEFVVGKKTEAKKTTIPTKGPGASSVASSTTTQEQQQPVLKSVSDWEDAQRTRFRSWLNEANNT